MDNIYDLENQWSFKYFQVLKIGEIIQNQSHGCFIDSPDWLVSVKNPISHTETKAKEVNPKKIST